MVLPAGARRCPTFPLFTFSAQALTYMGMAMTTSSQACTVPAFQWDMGVVLTSSTCCSRSTCSSPSDRLRLCLVGLHWLSESATHKRTGPCDGGGRADCDPESALPGCRLASPRHAFLLFKIDRAFVSFYYLSPIPKVIYAPPPT